MSNPLILNSVALLVALLSTTIRSVSATRNRKNHLSGTCRLFESPTGWQCEVTSLSSLWHSCHAAINSKSLHLDHTNFQFLISTSSNCLCLQCRLDTASMSKDQLLIFLSFDQPAGEPGCLPFCLYAGASWDFVDENLTCTNVCILVAWPGPSC